MTEYKLNTSAETAYARRWAFSFNPRYYSFEHLGGDCTNFVSQCIFAGGAVMNYTRDTGWYYRSLRDRAAAWTGVEFFCRFIINNKSVGPFGHLVPLEDASAGDVIQLGDSIGYYHSLLVIDLREGVPYVAAHTYPAYDRPLTSYTFERLRCIRIDGARRW